MPSLCQHPSPNHSPDLVSVYYGTTTPLTLCGYHTQHNLTNTLRKIEEAKK